MLKSTKRNKIVPIKVDLKILYENRHFFTNDVGYNSLIISNAINTKVNLINVECYNKLDHDFKYNIYAVNKDDYIFILDKNGLYKLIYYNDFEWGGNYEEHYIEHYNWKSFCSLYNDVYNYTFFKILTIV